jgi:type I restriction enzyme S subunit
MSFPRYPEYKDSGVEWLGAVPGHWEVQRIKTLTARIASGKTPLGGSEVYVDEGVTFLRSQNVYDEGLRLDDVAFISQAVDETMSVSRVVAGDILLNITGASIGRSCVVPDNLSPANVNQHVCVIRATKLSHIPFLGWSLKSVPIKSQIDHAQNGAAREGLNFDQVGRMVTALPPEQEQTQIAAFLDRETAKIDGLVAEQRRLMALLKEKRQAVISHAVTRGLNPDAALKPSGIEWLGDVPEHWEVGPLKRFWSVTDCKHVTAEFVDDGIPLASIREVQSRWVTLEGAKCTTEHFFELLIEGGRQPLPGDLIFSRNATVGEVAQVHADHPRFAMGQDVVLLRKLAQSDSSDYLQHVIRSPIIILQLANMMIGSTFKRINVEEIRSFLMPSPPPSEQAEIATFLETEVAKFDTLTTEAQRAIDLLQERRTALISAAVTGQIDVRGAAQSL